MRIDFNLVPPFELNPDPDTDPRSHLIWIQCGSGHTTELEDNFFSKFKKKLKVKNSTGNGSR
jgi:hypothetical protein